MTTTGFCGITYVIAQSKYLPMPNSAVTSSVPEVDRQAYEALDDVLASVVDVFEVMAYHQPKRKLACGSRDRHHK